MTTYYVSSVTGNNQNVGTSGSAPLASLQAAANVVKPGDTVEVMSGTYTAPFYGDALDITTSGTASAPITFEAAPGQTPIINSAGGWNAINIRASYVVVQGFTVVGDALNYTESSALAGYSTGSSQLDGNGIVVTTSSAVPLPNHITIENNTVYDEPGGGINTGGADYVQIVNNVVHNNGNWSAFGCSGISVTTSANLDTAAGPHIIVSGNLVYDNAQLVPTDGAGVVEDGEGIILDTNPIYKSEVLVEQNTVFGNGSSGIESFLTNGAVITGNTIYGNDRQSVFPAIDEAIIINQSNNNTVTNNNTSNPNVAVPGISQSVLNANDSVTLTGTASAGSTVTVSAAGATTALGTTVAGNNGSWSFTTPILAAGARSLIATATTSVGTSAASSVVSLTVSANAANSAAPNAPTIASLVETATDGVTVTGTAMANSTVNLKCNGGAIGTTTVSSTGAWSFTTGLLYPAPYFFTATATTPGGTSAASVAVGLTVVSEPPIAAPAAPIISSGTVNANDSVTLTGNAPAGATVIVSDGPGSTYSVGTAIASGTGAWSFTTPDLPTSAWAFTAVAKTSAGTSVLSRPFNVTVQDASPAAPVISNGVLNSNDTVTLTGTAVANSTVVLASNAGAAGITMASSSGAWSFTTADLSAGPYVFTATATTSLTTSAPSSPLKLTVLPVAPVIRTGAANANGSVTLTGTAVDGATVTVSDGGSTALGTTAASSSGAWSFTTGQLPAASYAFTATDTALGTTSAASSPLKVTVAASAAPSIPVVATAVEIANDSVTVTGTALANSVVNLSCNGGAVAKLNVGSSGTWNFTSTTLYPALYWYTATDTTSAGTSGASKALYVEFSPTISGAKVNSNGSVTLTGTATGGSGITVSDGGSSALGTTGASSTGAWSFTTADLSAASYAFTATDSSAGVVSAPSSPLKLTVLPVAPVIRTGAANANGSVTLTGTAVDGATVTVSDGGSTALGTTAASSSGAWSFTTGQLPAASYAFTATDTALGTTSAASSPLKVTVAASAAPSIPVVATAVEIANDSVTVTGTALANSVVNLSCNGGAVAKLNVGSSGTWNFTSTTLYPALYWYTATDTTSAGTSGASKALYVEFSPTISGAKVNSNGSVTLTGTATGGSGITVSDGGSSALGTTGASSTGAWSFTTADLSAASYAFTATDSSAGVVSAPSSPFDVTVHGSNATVQLGAVIATVASSAGSASISASASTHSAFIASLLVSPTTTSTAHGLV